MYLVSLLIINSFYTQQQKKVYTSKNVHISESISVIETKFLRYTSPLVDHRMHYNNKKNYEESFTKNRFWQLTPKNKTTQEIAKK